MLCVCLQELRENAGVHKENVQRKGNGKTNRDRTKTNGQAAVALFARRRA